MRLELDIRCILASCHKKGINLKIILSLWADFIYLNSFKKILYFLTTYLQSKTSYSVMKTYFFDTRSGATINSNLRLATIRKWRYTSDSRIIVKFGLVIVRQRYEQFTTNFGLIVKFGVAIPRQVWRWCAINFRLAFFI